MKRMLAETTLFWNERWKIHPVNGQEILLPSDWYLEPLGSLAAIQKGSALTRKEAKDGEVPVIAGGKTPAGQHNIPNRPPRTITVSASGANAGYVAYHEVEIFATDCTTVIGEKINQELLFNILKNRQADITLLQQGGAQPHVYASDLKLIQISYPPLPEQTLIAQVLTAQESQVHDLRKLAQAERQRLAWLSEELLSGRLRVEEDPTAESVVVSRNEKGEPVEVLPGVRVVENLEWKTVEMNGRRSRLPTEWRGATLDSITECLDSRRVPLSQKERAKKKGSTPYWGANSIVDYVDGHLLEGKFILLGEDAAPFFDKSKKVSFVVEGKIWPNNHIHVLNTQENHEFVCAQLNIFDYSTVLNTVVRPKLTQAGMKTMMIPLPPLPEQTLIAQVLTAQETQVLEIERLADLEQQRFEWLSEELLSGRIRVKNTKEN